MVRSNVLLIFVVAISLSIDLWAAPPLTDDSSDAPRKAAKDASRTKQRDESIKVMRESATETKVQIVGEQEDQPPALNTQPLGQWQHQPDQEHV